MRIAIAIERFDPAASGIERSTAQIADELIRRGHGITIITGDAPPELRIEGCEIISGHTVDFRHRVSVNGFSKWAPVALRSKPADVTLSMTMACAAMFVQPRGGVLAERLEREVVARDMDAKSLRHRAAAWLNLSRQARLRRERTTAADPQVRKFLAISHYVAEQLRRHHGLDETRLEMIPNSAAMPVVSDEERQASRRRVRKAFGVADDSVALLFLAQHSVRLKGAALLLHAAKKLLDQGRGITVLLAGHITFLELTLIDDLALREHVRMIGPTNEITQLLAASDLTVMPSYFDPSSRIVIESLLMGVPAISSRFNGASEFIVAADGEMRGRIVDDPLCADNVALAIEALLDPAERNRCAEAAVKAREEISLARHVDQLERLFLDATSSH